ncbi:hypothetical protein ACFW3Y_34685 [Streptomyces rochei]|uniref:hypothetical protein n=1 Tax=Streptomyces rochei TaxID=1928 RepID=UPI00367874B9
MTDVRFTAPELQALYALLAPTDTVAPRAPLLKTSPPPRAWTWADLAAVRRHTARAAASRRRSEGERRRENQRAPEDYAFEVLSRRAGHLRRSERRDLARAWTRLGLWPAELETWVGALGVNGAAIAQGCLTAGIAVSSMDIALDGMRVKQRLRGGEPVFSVLARATACGRSLSD